MDEDLRVKVTWREVKEEERKVGCNRRRDIYT